MASYDPASDTTLLGPLALVLTGFLFAVLLFFSVTYAQTRKPIARFQTHIGAFAFLAELCFLLSSVGKPLGIPQAGSSFVNLLPSFAIALLLPSGVSIVSAYASRDLAGLPRASAAFARRSTGRPALFGMYAIVLLVAGAGLVFQSIRIVTVAVLALGFVFASLQFWWLYPNGSRSTALKVSSASYLVLAFGMVCGMIPGAEIPGSLVLQSGLVLVCVCFFILQESDFVHVAGEAERAQGELSFLKGHDSLTGLQNRIALFERLERDVKELNCPCSALLYLDLDHFHDINDTLTNDAGNLLLRTVADRLEGVVSDRNSIYRAGEDEFAILVECPSAHVDAAMTAEKILGIFRSSFRIMGNEIYQTASIGIALFGGNEGEYENAEGLSRKVDCALSQAKLDRNTYRFYSEDLGDRGVSKLQYINYLRQSIDRHELSLHFQAQVDRDGHIVAAEALIRWTNPVLGNVPPSEFIPVAEEAGLIIPIGDWVIEHACAELAHWESLGIFIPMAINISARQLSDPRLERNLVLGLKKYGLHPENLHLEITESSLLDNSERNLQVLRDLSSQGFRLSIDDFGTGYANLSYLKRLPVSTIKIDRSFVVDLPENSQDMAVVQAIVNMARSMGYSTVAEGVDSIRQLRTLHAIDCNVVQGFFYSRPLPSHEFVEYALKLA